MPRTRPSLLVLALSLLSCSGAEPPPSAEPAVTTEPEAEPGPRMPAAKEYVALSDPSYGYASFAAGAPSQGEVAPDFELPTLTGERLRLHDALAEGPVLLMIYRGWW